ncbi:Putative mannose-1-phosphate guanylyltransferase/mannose-6-phosphate isomerase [Thermobacillus xylanilyticus]|uniref:Mannose-1-phosphate guanylyltransferase/mannose-6-phosphate isomerase n=1 Tax=Thermobacillus xylanilyticus TaxID=76633 RepID=A0ABN7S4M5_THEXY|nr:mannose-1-phosphate guanylyltransferase [Thermobacillus xylanilyticus]CAG5092000.1 Putative mannose-1-phosphate guanylyltransferase/mannose-6-phosphate isomerase [Thermobacillus xylanilyticus]
MQLAAVIMAGGKGERFWPKSRTKLPKQFLNIFGSKTLIQQSIERLEKLIPITRIFVVTNELYAEIIKAQIPHLPYENIIIETVGKNTAPCIGLASIIIEERFPDSTMVVMPSDHLIRDEEELLNILKAAIKYSEQDHVITLGIKPRYPETGYGYIQIDTSSKISDDPPVYGVKRFVEKPDIRSAQVYYSLEDYYWNSGMFIWKVSLIRRYIQTFLPEIHDLLEIMKSEMKFNNTREVVSKHYHKMTDISIDYGIMEKIDGIQMIPCNFGWDDIGSWTALERINDTDEFGNVIKGNIMSIDTRRCIIESNGKLIATLGVEDLIIVQTEDVTLICHKNKAQDIKNIITELKSQKKDQYL